MLSCYPPEFPHQLLHEAVLGYSLTKGNNVAPPTDSGSWSSATRFTSAKGTSTTETSSSTVVSQLRHPISISSSPKSRRRVSASSLELLPSKFYLTKSLQGADPLLQSADKAVKE